jgi:hypothetical protein
MPISPENKLLYPANWKEISKSIRERAGDRCEFCGVSNYAVGYRNSANEFIEIECSFAGDMEALDAISEGYKIIKIILTVAHLDHNPSNCDPANLRCLCQKCHNTYDRKHRNINAQATNRKKKGMQDLFKNTM